MLSIAAPEPIVIQQVGIAFCTRRTRAVALASIAPERLIRRVQLRSGVGRHRVAALSDQQPTIRHEGVFLASCAVMSLATSPRVEQPSRPEVAPDIIGHAG